MRFAPGARKPGELYDTVFIDVSAAPTRADFFAVPAGQAGKTISDTNVRQARQLPANTEFEVQEIILHPWPAIELSLGIPSIAYDELHDLLTRANFVFEINGDLAFEGPVFVLASGGGVSWENMEPVASRDATWHNAGTPNPQATYRLRKPFLIAPGDSFSLYVEWAATPCDVDCYLAAALRGIETLPTVQAA